jgi:hypothetical protein
MSCTKNVSTPGGGDDEDPRRPFRQVKGKTVYLEQQEGRKKRHMDRAARAAAVKGKCALGPFLCILVIECQHMCLIGNLCTWMNKVKIMK